MKVICIANAKGGVAKTTTALALSLFLALKKKKVLLMDLDPQSNATTTLLKLPIAESLEEGTMYEVFETYTKKRKQNLLPEIIQQSKINPKLFVAPANLEMERLKDFVKLHNRKAIQILENLIKPIENDYDFLIIDCPADISIYVENAINIADKVILPTLYDEYGVNALSMMVPTILDIKGDDFEDYNVLFTLFNPRATKIQEKLKEYTDQLKQEDKAFDVMIPVDQSIRNWQSERADLFSDKSFSRSKARASYEEIGKQIIKWSKK